MNTASFRGSSELEFGADAVFLLVPSEGGGIAFKCDKNRYGPATDLRASFDPTTQTFAPAVEVSGLDGFDAATPAPTRGSRAKGD